MRIPYFLIQMNKMLKSRYGTKTYKSLRKNVWNTFWFLIFASIGRMIESFFMWWIAILYSKKIEQKIFKIFRIDGHYLRFLDETHKREIKCIGCAMALRNSYAEEISNEESAQGYVNWRCDTDYNYADFNQVEKDYIVEWLGKYDFDTMRSELKTKLSRFYYYLFLFLDFEQVVRPLVPKWYIPKKGYWYRAWMFWCMRNPKSNQTCLSPRFKTSNLYVQELEGFDNTNGEKTSLEGIGGQVIGEMFWFTKDQKYFNYQTTSKDGKWWLQFGYGVKPNYHTARGSLEMMARLINK